MIIVGIGLSNIFAIAGLVTGGVLGLLIFTGILLLARANARDHQRAWDWDTRCILDGRD